MHLKAMAANVVMFVARSGEYYFCCPVGSLIMDIANSGCSSVRFRVLVWGARGREFESRHPDKVRQPLKVVHALRSECALRLFAIPIDAGI